MTTMQAGITNIRQSKMEVRIASNRILINDIAFATDRHRVVVRGSLAMDPLTYEKVIIAIVNPRGCIKVEMTVTGPLDNPTTSLNPIKSDDNCTPFYQGPVKHPPS